MGDVGPPPQLKAKRLGRRFSFARSSLRLCLGRGVRILRGLIVAPAGDEKEGEQQQNDCARDRPDGGAAEPLWRARVLQRVVVVRGKSSLRSVVVKATSPGRDRS
jgi:hypothetical protein